MSIRAKNLTRGKQGRSSSRRHVLLVRRSNAHVYALLYHLDEKRVLASVSSLSKSLRSELKTGGNREAAYVVGQAFAKMALDMGIKQVAFDRNGLVYTGRIAELARGAREGGLDV